jgi:acetate kinase
MKPAGSRILTINGGSSSIKFALFQADGALRRILGGELDRIGTPQAALRVTGSNQATVFRGQWRRLITQLRWAL